MAGLRSVLFTSLWIFSLAGEDTKHITAKHGEDVPLHCQGPRDADIPGIVWSRRDLESQKFYVFFRENRPYENYQLPSYRGRVTLSDPEMKDGNVSVVLKNVSVNDTGTYQCRVIIRGGDGPKLYSTIQLTVSVSDVIVVTARPGDDVILPCQAADSFIRAVEWSRPDLEPEYVFFYRDGHLDLTYQHPSYKDRVELVDRDLKDGDVSLILKKVNVNDRGTYECRVAPDSSRRKKRAIIDSEPITVIQLQVPGSNDENSSPVSLYLVLAAGVPGALLLVTAAVVGVRTYKRCKDKS